MQLGVFLSEILKKKRRSPLLVLTSSPPPAQVFLPFPHRRNWQLVTNARQMLGWGDGHAWNWLNHKALPVSCGMLSNTLFLRAENEYFLKTTRKKETDR